MNPQGSTIYNAAYFAALTSQVSKATSCSQLQALVTPAFASINAQLAALAAQVALLEAMLALLTPPTSPTAAVTWIETFISAYLTPQLVAAATYTAQLTALTAAVASLTAAITSKAAQFTSCSITIP
jgi:hypothetical protein